jgi:hypothetical protein
LLALVATLGMFSHMTMVAAVALTTLFVYVDLRTAVGTKEAVPATARLMGPAIGASIAVVVLVLAAAFASATGMRVGGYAPFKLREYGMALDQLSGWAIGLAAVPWWLRLLVIGLGAAAVALRPPPWLGSRGRLYGILILGIPVAALVLRPGNTGFARYYVTSLVGLLLLIGGLAGRALEARKPIRWATAAILLALVGLNLAACMELIRMQRGRPDAPVADMARLSPAGARVAVDPRFEAVITVAATRAHYPVRFAKGCEPAEFLFAPHPLERKAPAMVVHCGLQMRELDSSTTSPMTGDAWALYRR